MDHPKPAAGIGHNAPLLVALAEPEIPYAAWSREHAALLARRDQLLAAREQAAQQAREAADAVAASAQADTALREQALALDQAAQQAEIAVTAGLTALARTRGESGAVADLKEEWTYEVVNPAQVPREWLMVDDRKLRAAIRGPDGLRSIPGLRIHPEARTTVR